jgi:hypothetical protein
MSTFAQFSYGEKRFETQTRLARRAIENQTFSRLHQLLRWNVLIDLSIIKVLRNSGSKTPGMDGKTRKDYVTNSQKKELREQVKDILRNYTSSPVRRIYIPKPHKRESWYLNQHLIQTYPRQKAIESHPTYARSRTRIRWRISRDRCGRQLSVSLQRLSPLHIIIYLVYPPAIQELINEKAAWAVIGNLAGNNAANKPTIAAPVAAMEKATTAIDRKDQAEIGFPVKVKRFLNKVAGDVNDYPWSKDIFVIAAVG